MPQQIPQTVLDLFNSECCPSGGGSGEGDKNFVYNQSLPSNNWVIIHNLNKRTSVIVVDTAGTEIQGEVVFISNNEIHIKFNSANAGQAYLN